MEYVLLYLAVNVIVGLAACFFGKKLFYVLLALLVFLGVFNVVLMLADPSPVAYVVAAALGIAAAVLSRYAYKAGVFLMGFFAGAALAAVVGQLLLPADVVSYLTLIALAVGVVVGLIASSFADKTVRVGTAWVGASFAAPSLLALVLAFGEVTSLATADALTTFEAVSGYLSGPFASAQATPILACTVVLAVVGFFVQAREH